MGRLVEVADGQRGLALPDGGVYAAGDQVTLSDAEFAEVPSEWIGPLLTDLGSAAEPPLDRTEDIPVDGAASVPSLRTLGGGATQASRGNHTHAGGGGEGAALSDAIPQALGTAAAGAGDAASRDDHVHQTPPTNPAAGTAGLRSLGTTSTTAAAGNHAHSGVYDPAGTAATAVAAIPSGGTAGTPALRALGTSSTTAAAGNDGRLSDSRTPTAHASTHASAGSDPVTPAAIGASATGHNHSGTYDPAGTATTAVAAIPADGSAGTASLRTLGTGSAQASAGNHSHTATPAGPRVVSTRVTTGTSGGDTPTDSSSAWVRYTGVGTLVIAAAVGDYVEVSMSMLTNRSDTGLLFDLALYVSGSAVWYASTGTATPATEGDPALYPTLRPTGWYADLLVESGHLSSGNLTFGLGYKGNGTGKIYYSTAYPFRWRALNFGVPTT